MNLNTNTGVISGYPAPTRTNTYTVTAIRGNCSITQDYTFAVVCPVLSFVNTAVVDAVLGSPYTLNVTATGGSLQYFVAPILPAGLALNINTGIISGTPTTSVVPTTYVVTARLALCSISQNYVFGVLCPIVTFNTSPAPSAVIGSSYSFSIGTVLNGNNISYSTSPALPSGFVLLTSGTSIMIVANGWAINTPIPSTTYTITITTGNCIVTQTCTFAVVCSPAIFTNTVATNATYNSSYTLNASATGYGITGYSVNPALPLGLNLNTNTGVISGYPAPTPTNTYTVTAIRGNCSITQDYMFAVVCPVISFVNTTVVNAVVGNLYTLNVSAIGAGQYSVAPSLPAGLNLNQYTGIISGTPTTNMASTTYVVTATQGLCSATQNYVFGVICATVIFNTSSAPNAIIGGAYYVFNTVTSANGNGTISYSIAPALPVGWGLTASGAIVGWASIPTLPITYTVTATQGTCTTTQTYTFAVVCQPATFTNTTAINAIYNSFYTLNASATGSGITGYSVSPALPLGLNLNTSTGIISGYALVTPSTTYTITAIRGNCNSTQNYTFAVVCPPIVIGNVSLPNGGINGGYNQTIRFIGSASAPIVWSVFSGALPAGLILSSSGTFNTSGLISGTSITLGTFTFVIQTTSINDCPRQTSYTIIITPNGLRVNTIAEVIAVSPNPTSGDFNIDFSILDITNATMVVYNSQGRRVLSANIDNSQMLISLVNEPAGLYLLEITNASGKIIKRLLKQ